MKSRAFVCFILSAFLLVSLAYSGDKVVSEAAKTEDQLRSAKISDKWGFRNHESAIVIPPQFEAAQDFSEGLGLVKIDGKWGFIYANGAFAINPTFYYAESFHDGIALVQTDLKEHGGWAFIDHKGNAVVTSHFIAKDCTWTSFPVAAHGQAPKTKAKIRLRQSDDGSRREACLSKGIAVYAEEEPEGDKPWSWSLKGYVNDKDEVIVPARFCRAYPFSNGLAAVQQCSYDRKEHKVISFGKWGFIDSTGNFVLSAKFDDAGDFSSDGMAEVLFNAQYGIIRKDGTWEAGPGGHCESASSNLTMFHGSIETVKDDTGVSRSRF